MILVHSAGTPIGWVQVCSRCLQPLVNNKDMPEPWTFFAVGAAVATTDNRTIMRPARFNGKFTGVWLVTDLAATPGEHCKEATH